VKIRTLARDGELCRLLEEIRTSLSGWTVAIEPERLVFALRFDEFVRGCTSWRLSRAERELARVHTRELARLLREAAALRIELAAELAPERLAAWRCAFREELACAAKDRARATATLHVLLRRMRSEDASSWPLASELARASLALHDTPAARAALGEACLHEGRAAEASASFVEVLSARIRPRTAARALDGLVRAQLALGEDERAERLRTCA
jgi:hypothetical protein